jgi:hypothetical protein
MNPKPIYAGLLACITLVFASCHTSQSTTYVKKPAAEKQQTIQLPNVSQQLQVEVVEEKKGNN